MTRVLIADDQALVRDGFRSILEREDDIAVVGEAQDGLEALRQAAVARPDVVLMDLAMPVLDGLAATERLLARPDAPRVLVLTTYDTDENLYRALRVGASGFLLKDVRARQLVDANRTSGLGIAQSADLKTDQRYPRCGPAASRLGIGSALSVGLFPKQEPPRMGILNFYSTRSHGLDDVDCDIAVVLASHASTALAGTIATTAAELKVAHLEEALRSRDVIGQAKGVLMERRGVSADEAFAILRQASQSLNIKLVTVATTLAEQRGEI